ncbi:NAD(P)H-quinone oxidoreductase [Neorhizobium sp. LjRoot104]|uniref:NAD(P)H-quinone oxidoreductase n=1 Tax=Neorhizobium sp. LjRoot104 TaxID=3342254 RepID=UPI003ECC858D
MTVPDFHQEVQIASAGGPETLQVRRQPTPRLGVGKVLIKVAAAGVNRHDCNQRAQGAAHDGTLVPGLEVCGKVVMLGEDSEAGLAGKRVMALVQGGGYAQYAIAEQALVLPAPDGLSDAEAASLPEALFTAWYNFFVLMKLERDGFGLIHGGTSGVGHVALQAMSALGYRVLATAGTDEKVAAAKGFGAFEALNYNDPALADKARAATGGHGISALLDLSAGAHIDADLAMMASGGRIAHLSGGSGKAITVPLRNLMARQIWITGSLLRPLALASKTLLADMLRRDVMPLFDQGAIRPHIAARFPLTEAWRAHHMMEQNSHIGKIVLVSDDNIHEREDQS